MATERIDIDKVLDVIFRAERDLRQHSQTLLQAPHGALLGRIRVAFNHALGIEQEQERSLRLVCLTRLLRSVPGPGAIDLLIDILANESEEARQGAGLVLEDVAYDRLGEVRKGIERALKRLPVGSAALCELPFVVLGLGDADIFSMLKPFLKHKDPEAVAAAIEAYVEYADPAAIALIRELCDDSRSVQVEDESTGDAEQMTVGDLAVDALDALGEIAKMMASESRN
ncbi:MAG: hypothetical protein CSA75_05225 [Sorangium cellulosum]|nr:MAG: hypothetical protein CSA75_05225 [Sorangium cellulosum]